MTPRLRLIAAAAVLVLAANAVVLVGVAHNRGGEPSSRLALSQRELARHWSALTGPEDGALALHLKWRVLDARGDPSFDGNGGTPAWLDDARLAALGFDLARARGLDPQRGMRVPREERPALVVLELGGAAWQQALARARERMERQEALRAARPDAPALVEAARRARDELAREETTYSRLFAIDAGTDLAALRARYPDRGRYLVLAGRVRLQPASADGRLQPAGTLGDLAVERIQVPQALRPKLAPPPLPAGAGSGKTAPFTAVVAVGRRLEPWIESISAP